MTRTAHALLATATLLVASAVPLTEAQAQGAAGAAVLNTAGFPVKGITKRATTIFVESDAASSSRPYDQFKFV